MSVEKSTVANLGFTMDYFTFGEGDRPFVILPGLSIKPVSGMAKNVADAYTVFHKDFKTYVFDRRSDVPEGYSVFDMAEDTAAAIRELGLKDINLFGASQGGMIALVIAITHPELVKKLALGSSAADACDLKEGVLDHWLELAKNKEGAELCDVFGKTIYPPETYREFAPALRLMGSTVKDDEFERFVITASAIKSFDVRDRLKDIKCPVLAMTAVPDNVIGEKSAADLRNAFAGREDFKEFFYEGYGHAAFDTAPNYKERIYEFFMN